MLTRNREVENEAWGSVSGTSLLLFSPHKLMGLDSRSYAAEGAPCSCPHRLDKNQDLRFFEAKKRRVTDILELN